MESGFAWGATKVWRCSVCDARNVTAEGDTFSDQCRNCTEYNRLDWSERGDVSLREARAALDADR